MSKAAEHQDAERLDRATSGLPPDVRDPDTEAAYQALAKRPAKSRASSPKPTRKGGKAS